MFSGPIAASTSRASYQPTPIVGHDLLANPDPDHHAAVRNLHHVHARDETGAHGLFNNLARRNQHFHLHHHRAGLPNNETLARGFVCVNPKSMILLITSSKRSAVNSNANLQSSASGFGIDKKVLLTSTDGITGVFSTKSPSFI